VALGFAVLALGACQVPQIPPPEDVAAAPAEATVLESGLAYKVLAAGTGPQPAENDTVRVHYTGWTTDGTTFDSSISRGEPTEFPLRAVIAGWTEGLQYMQEGAKHRLWIPESLAYRGQKGKPAGMLVFDVELIEIK
jgi:peptidylprolyl isomerase